MRNLPFDNGKYYIQHIPGSLTVALKQKKRLKTKFIMLLKKVFQLTTASFKYNPDLLKFRIKQYSDQKEKDEYVNAKYGQKIAWENSKSKKTPEMRWLKKEQNKYLQT